MHKITRTVFMFAATLANTTCGIKLTLKKSFPQEKTLYYLLANKQSNRIESLTARPVDRPLTSKEETLLENYFKTKITHYVTQTKFEKTCFKLEEQATKNFYAIAIFYTQLVEHFFKTFTENNKYHLKDIFDKLSESPTKWLVRFLYYKLHNELVDNLVLAQIINEKINESYNQYLALEHLNKSKELTAFLNSASILTPYYRKLKFVNLEGLYLKNNQLTSIDVSTVINLKWLCLTNNQLKTIDISKLINLKVLYLDNNQLTSIDISKLTNLEGLYLKSNQINTIDVSKLINLKSLDLSNNQLKTIDDSQLANLKWFNYNGNSLKKN